MPLLVNATSRPYVPFFVEAVEANDAVTTRVVSLQAMSREYNGPQVVYNTEQLSREFMLRIMVTIVLNDLCVEFWDYSEANLRILRRAVPEHLFTKKCRYVPLVIRPERVLQVVSARSSAGDNFLADLGFVASDTPRRREVVGQLEILGLTVHWIRDIQVSLDDQLEQMARCRAVLNVHACDDYEIFEAHRCAVFLDAGVPVISEDSLDNDPRLAFTFRLDTLPREFRRWMQTFRA